MKLYGNKLRVMPHYNNKSVLYRLKKFTSVSFPHPDLFYLEMKWSTEQYSVKINCALKKSVRFDQVIMFFRMVTELCYRYI